MFLDECIMTSFIRTHVDIGNRPNESPHFSFSNALEQQQQQQSQPQPQYQRQLPVNLTEDELIKEAAKVLAQSERIRCTADTPNSLAGIRQQEKLLDGKWVKVDLKSQRITVSSHRFVSLLFRSEV